MLCSFNFLATTTYPRSPLKGCFFVVYSYSDINEDVATLKPGTLAVVVVEKSQDDLAKQ